MKISILMFLGLVVCVNLILSCRNEFGSDPVSPVLIKDSVSTTCKVPSIEKNIIGNWNFVSTIAGTSSPVTGTVLFNSDGSIIGPAFVFGDNVIGATIMRLYTIQKSTITNSGQISYLIEIKTFGGNQSTSNPKAYGSTLFTIKSNNCLKMEITPLINNDRSLILTR